MPVAGLVLASCAPVLVQEVAKTVRRWLKERGQRVADRRELEQLQERVAELEAQRRWAP